MLNRRNLRIKVMQSLFALHQCQEANYELCRDVIRDRFSPDLNSMEVQDKTLLSKLKTQALKVFDKNFSKEDNRVTHDDQKIEKAVNDAFDFYVDQQKKDTEFFKKSMVTDTEKIYDHYIAILSLAATFGNIAASDKKVNHQNFAQNAWIQALQKSEELRKQARRTNQDWSRHSDQVKIWFRDVVRQDTEYQAYLDKRKPSVDEQKKFINHLFRRIILGKTIINDFFEEEVLRWAEDKDIVKALVEKTVKSYNPEEDTEISLHTLSLNWDEDREFLEKLFEASNDLAPKYRELIARNTRNWEVERLPLTDRVILEMAIGEMLSFPNVPVKVTINEFIELAKQYSTPKSRQFINGILDVIARELKESGEMKKSGRGLIDNK